MQSQETENVRLLVRRREGGDVSLWLLGDHADLEQALDEEIAAAGLSVKKSPVPVAGAAQVVEFLLLAFPANALAIAALIEAWARRIKSHSTAIEIGGDKVAVTGPMSEAERTRLIDLLKEPSTDEPQEAPDPDEDREADASKGN